MEQSTATNPTPSNISTPSPTPNPQVNTAVNNLTQTAKAPWSTTNLFIASLIFWVPGGVMIVWQNLRRIGKDSLATKFLVISWALLILYGFIPQTPELFFRTAVPLGLAPSLWYYFFVGRSWQKEHPGQTKFSFPLIGWGILGVVIYVVIVAFVAVVRSYLPGSS